MRSRNLKPGFFKNEELAEIEPIGRLLYQGLWCLADREGRLEDRPKRIKAEILPYDNCGIEKLLNLLHAHGFIIRYSVNGNRYIYIPTFKKHQTPHMKEQESTIPAPDLSDASTMQEQESGASTGQAPDMHESCPSSSFNPLPSSLNPLVRHAAPPVQDDFDLFWNEYPRKIGKKDAKLAWKKAKDKPPIGKILESLNAQKGSEQWVKDDGQFIPHPSTWIRKGRWDDEVTDMATGRNPYAGRCKHLNIIGKCRLCDKEAENANSSTRQQNI